MINEIIECTMKSCCVIKVHRFILRLHFVRKRSLCFSVLLDWATTKLWYVNSQPLRAHHIKDSIDPRSCIHDDQLLGGIRVCLPYGLNECLIFPALLCRQTDQRLTAPCDGCMCNWMKPGEDLGRKDQHTSLVYM